MMATSAAEINSFRSMPARGCAVCGVSRTEKIYSQQFEALSSESLLQGYDVVACPACGFVYADYIPSQAEFDTYYANMSKYESQQYDGCEAPIDRERFDDLARRAFEAIGSKERRVLEIGCATGAVLGRLKRMEVQHVVGVDPSPVCKEICYRKFGVPVHNLSLDTLSQLNETFDLVILSHVLEHVADLRSALLQIRNRLNNGGKVLIEVPDASRFSSAIDAPFQQFSIEHINFFSPSSLMRLMSENGFVHVSSDRQWRPQSRLAQMPVVTAVFARAESPVASEVVDSETMTDLFRYIEKCRSIDERIQKLIGDLADSSEPLLVWGVGTHTQRLLKESRLKNANMVAFIDTNSRYWGKQLFDKPIIGPHQLSERNERILISSCVSQEEIADQIRGTLPNEVIRLYGTSIVRT